MYVFRHEAPFIQRFLNRLFRVPNKFECTVIESYASVWCYSFAKPMILYLKIPSIAASSHMDSENVVRTLPFHHILLRHKMGQHQIPECQRGKRISKTCSKKDLCVRNRTLLECSLADFVPVIYHWNLLPIKSHIGHSSNLA